MSAERERVSGFGRLEDGLLQASDWYLWGPYLSERQWGTVREDYSPDGDAWSYLPHDHARSRAYRWGEGGLAGFSDIHQRLCLGLALWNGRDPILKERAYGLTGAATDLEDRLISIFLVGPDGRRPCFGWTERLQQDPAWKDNLMFSEYFHGDNGAGLGASHQTGWTGLVADVIRRRHGGVRALGGVLRNIEPEGRP
jgi:hypothetical protein